MGVFTAFDFTIEHVGNAQIIDIGSLSIDFLGSVHFRKPFADMGSFLHC